MAVVATIGLCVLVVKEWVIPTQTAALNNQVAALKTQLDQVSELTRKKAEAEKKIAALEGDLAKSNAQLKASQLANLFPVGSPYPVGLSAVRVGDPITRVDEVYSGNVIDKDVSPGFWSVTTKHAAFRAVTYYFDEHSKRQEISQILFHFSGGIGAKSLAGKLGPEPPTSSMLRKLLHSPEDEALLLGKLTDALGAPKYIDAAKGKQYVWTVGALEVSMDKEAGSTTFSIRKR